MSLSALETLHPVSAHQSLATITIYAELMTSRVVLGSFSGNAYVVASSSYLPQCGSRKLDFHTTLHRDSNGIPDGIPFKMRTYCNKSKLLFLSLIINYTNYVLNSISICPILCTVQYSPPIQWVPEALSPGVKWPGRETDNSPPSSAEVKNGGLIPTLPHTSPWNNVSLIKHSDILTFAFLQYSSSSHQKLTVYLGVLLIYLATLLVAHIIQHRMVG
jgi:hypothetical protein